jgi:aminopeptidase N
MRIILVIIALLSSGLPTIAQNSKHHCQASKRNVPLRGGSVLEDPGNARSDSIDIQHYEISLDFTMMNEELIKASCKISYTALISNLQVMHLDLLGLVVDSISSPNGSLEYAHAGESLFVQLGDVLNSNESGEMTIYYHGSPMSDPTWGGFYFSSSYAYNLGVGFTSVPHNLGRVWFPCFDNFVERSTYTFHVLTSEGRTAYCNGMLTAAEVVGNDSLLSHWQLEQTIPTYLACVAVSNYTHAALNYESTTGENIPMWLVAKAIDTTDMKQSMINLPSCMAGFEDDYGPYRWSRVGFTAVPFNAGAMEHATSIAYPLVTLDGTTTYETLMAHELSHHWWGDLVTCKNANDMWLNEGWARFSEAIFLENQYGVDEYDNFMSDLLKDLLLYAHRNDGERYPVSGVPNTATYGDHVYNKGAVIAHNLRVYMGDDDFFDAIRNLMNELQFTAHTSLDFRDYMQSYTSADLNAFFDSWIFEPGLPEFRLKQFFQTSVDAWELHIQQFQHYSSGYYEDVPLSITARDSDGELWAGEVLVGGELSIVSVTLPNEFVPEVFFLSAGGKLKYAVLAEENTINDDGINNFSYAEMEVDVETLGDIDSIFMRVENHWAAADENLIQGDYFISPDRWWNVWHNGSSASDITATIRYYGDESNAKYFDPLLFEYFEANGYNEDSLVLLYRPDGVSPWQLYQNYEVLTSPGIDNWNGRIRMYDLQSGQYAFGAPTGPTNISEFNVSSQTIYYNNHRIACRTGKAEGTLKIYDSEGRLLWQESTKDNVDIAAQNWAKGVYIANWSSTDGKDQLSAKLFID